MTSQLNTRNHIKGENHTFVSPWVELNAGLWSLFGAATIFLALRIWCKVTKRFGLWYDDYILVVAWMVLFANNILIVWQFNNGYILKYSTEKWDERMRILINISSCGTLLGQAWTKTAFGVTLLRMTTHWYQWILWFCIITMNLWMFFKILFQWAQICDKDGYTQYWRLDFCVSWKFREEFKEGGNVWNIIMDFTFATFPWLIVRKLEMRKAEKIGLCVTMSLGMIVAIVAAIRVGWKDEGNSRDEYYLYRNGVSQVWYSSEITGTIIVQCIPILRPILREFTNSITSRDLRSLTAGTEQRQSITWVSRFSSKRGSHAPSELPGAKNESDRIALREIPEEDSETNFKRTMSTSTYASRQHPATPLVSPFLDTWPMGAAEPSSTSLDMERNANSQSFYGFDADLEGQKGLSPPPRR